MEAIAEHSYTTKELDELSFKKDTILKIISKVDQNWYRAEFSGREGLVPANYVKLNTPSWYVPDVKRAGAEDLLRDKGYNGAFCVRQSESSPGDFSISVLFEGTVQHFKVLRDGNGKYFLWLVKFDSINSLVEHHKKNSVSKEQRIVLKDMEESRSGTGGGEYAEALYDFQPQDQGEVAFTKGDKLLIVQRNDANWWTGTNTRTHKTGLFPVNYVRASRP